VRDDGPVEVRSYAASDLPADLRARVVALQNEAWPSESGTSHDPALRPVSMVLIDGGDVVAALDVLSKDLRHGGRRYRASGLSAVVTRPDVRRRGHGGRLVTAAKSAIAASGADVGLFTCDRPLREFYESAGWEFLPGTVVVGGTRSAPFPSDQDGFDKVTMAAFFSAVALRYRADFENCRIELYPGDIDKLW
jgi:GNAT superfamily N-acetyltransferase